MDRNWKSPFAHTKNSLSAFKIFLIKNNKTFCVLYDHLFVSDVIFYT